MTTYDNGLADEWSNLYNFADVAAMVYDIKQRLRKGKSKKSVSDEEEEESEKSFFHIFPRRSRSCITRRQNRFQNLNGASTSSSSSLLPDLNLIPVDFETNYLPLPLPSLPSSSFLGNYKITADSEMKNPQNPNSQLSPCKSRKRRAVQERKRNKGLGFKKAKVVVPFSWKGKETPERLLQLMRNMNGAEDPRLIVEKTLFETDVNPKESRFSIPFNTLIRDDFLTPVESRIIEDDIDNDKKTGVGAILVDPRSVKWGVMFKRWEMKKDSGKGSWNYALTCGWNDIVKANKLEKGHTISLWSFRFQDVLCFALVPPPPTMA